MSDKLALANFQSRRLQNDSTLCPLELQRDLWVLTMNNQGQLKHGLLQLELNRQASPLGIHSTVGLEKFRRFGHTTPIVLRHHTGQLFGQGLDADVFVIKVVFTGQHHPKYARVLADHSATILLP